jgi:YVTN family beta-propeller protein
MQQRLSTTKIWIVASLSATLSIAVASAQPFTYVSNIAGNNVAVVDTIAHAKVATISVPGYPSGLAVTPDGLSVYVACQSNNTVAVLSTASNTVTATIPVGTTPTQLAITPNGAQVYVVIRGLNQVSVIDTASKTVIATIGVGARPSAVTFSPDGSKAYVANNSDGTVSVIGTASRSVINTFPANAGSSGVAILPNGNVYVSNQSANTVTVHDTNGNPLTTIGGFTSPNWAAAAPNGSRVLVTNGNSKSVGVIDTSSNTLIATIPTGNIPTSVAISSDSTRAYVANEYSFTLSQIDVTSNTLMNTQSNIGAYPFGVAIAPPASSGQVCTPTLSQAGISFTAAGGTGGVNVTVQSGCAWTAVSNQGWAQITGGASGNGNGTVTFSVNPNLGTSPLSGTLTIASQTFTISETGTAFSPIRVNCGGPQLTDGNGNVWAAGSPQNYSFTTLPINGTTTPLLYQGEAWSTGTLQYQYTVPNGSFTVKLKFAEFYVTQAGQRTFNIVVNGVTYFFNYDILATVGSMTANDLSIPVVVSNGQITIQLVPVTGHAKLNALEIF